MVNYDLSLNDIVCIMLYDIIIHDISVWYEKSTSLYHIYQMIQSHITLKHCYNEHTYSELMLTTKRFSYLVTLLHAVNFTDITNSADSEAKSPVSDTSL